MADTLTAVVQYSGDHASPERGLGGIDVPASSPTPVSQSKTSHPVGCPRYSVYPPLVSRGSSITTAHTSLNYGGFPVQSKLVFWLVFISVFQAALSASCYCTGPSTCIANNSPTCNVNANTFDAAFWCDAACTQCGDLQPSRSPTIAPTPQPSIVPTTLNRPTVGQNITRKFKPRSQLNGSNGEYTGDDDRPRKVAVVAIAPPSRPGRKKAKNNKKKGKKPRVVVSLPSERMNMKISRCSAQYGLACVAPFDVRARGVCMPVFPAIDSYKATPYVEGDFTIGTSGWGFIALAPCVANDKTCIWYSQSTYAGTTLSSDSTITGVSVASLTTCPFTASQLSTGAGNAAVRGRLVSVGLEVFYTGTVFNKGGLVSGLSHPEHYDVNGMSSTDISLFPTALAEGDRGEKWLLTTSAMRPEEERYPDPYQVSGANTTSTLATSFPYFTAVGAASPSTSACPVMGFLIKGAAGNPYHFRVIEHVEYVGALVQGRATKSEVDDRGFSAVNTAVKDIGAAARTTGKWFDPVKELAINIKDNLSMASADVDFMSFAKGAAQIAGSAMRGYSAQRGTGWEMVP